MKTDTLQGVSEHIVWLKNVNKNDVSIAGGKGSCLGELMKVGNMVANGFVITSSCYDLFFGETNLNSKIESILSKVDYSDERTYKNAELLIKKLVINIEMPVSIVEEIRKSFIELGSRTVAVRSSATVEDSATDAWAGLLESYLNTNEQDLIKCVKECWASLFTPQSISYRYERGLQKRKISVAVIVQQMIKSEQSGVAFSVHPVTEDKNQLIIEAINGVGESIVSGKVTPDSYIVLKKPLRILDKFVRSTKQILEDDKILELSKLILKIEKYFAYPCDIEWAYENERLYIVQSRPITTLTDDFNPLDSENTALEKNNEDPRSIKNQIESFVTEAFTKKYKFALFFDVLHVGVSGDDNHFEGEQMHSLGGRTDNMHEAFLKVAARSLIWGKEIGVYYKTTIVNSLGDYYVDTKSWNNVDKFFKSKNIAYAKQYIVKLKILRDKTTEEITENSSRDFTEKFIYMMSYFFIIRSIFEKIYSCSNKDDQKFIEKWRNDDTHFQPLEMYYKEYPENDRPSNADWSLVLKDGSLRVYDKNITFENRSTNDLDRKHNEFKRSGVIRGSSAFPGKVKGVVKLIYAANEVASVNRTDIIVAPMTTVNLLPIMKSSLAIVTDEGGITSHAAIAAREFKKPCIIGTKIATEVLKDGDFIEVDANLGTIKVLS